MVNACQWIDYKVLILLKPLAEKAEKVREKAGRLIWGWIRRETMETVMATDKIFVILCNQS